MHPSVLEDVRVKLRGIADLERICSVIQEGSNVKVKHLLDIKEACSGMSSFYLLRYGI